MKKSNFTTKQKMLIIIAFLLVFDLYFSLWINTLVTGYSLSASPIVLIKCMIDTGFPTGLFFVFAFVSAIFCLLAYTKIKHDNKGMDIRGRAFKMAQGRQSYGESHFETPEEYEDLAIIQDANHAYGTILGQLDDSGKHLINIRMDEKNRQNQNIAIVGASGTGKTYTFSKNYCYQVVRRRESIVVTDPDGGLYADMAGYFMDNGYIVRRLDLNKLHRSDGWDCLKSVMGDDAELNAQLFAQIVISNVSGGDKGGIYTDGPMSLLKALILRVVLGNDYPPEKKNIKTVYSLLQNPGGEEFLDSVFNSETIPPGAEPSIGPYLTFKQGSQNLRGNLITNLTTQLQLFQSQTVCKVLSTDDIDLLRPAQQPCAYFCIFPDSHDTYKFIVSLFFSMLFIRLIGFADDQPKRRCPIPVNFLLDEFPSIGRLPDFDRKMATIRKRAINVAMIFQDITQLQHNYEDTWVTLLSNCATFLSLGINDEYTSNLVTKRIGDTTIEAKTEQHAGVMTDFWAVYRPNSTGEGKRALLSYDELFKLDKDESIIIFQGHNPILSRKYPHVLHPESKKLRTINPTDISDIDDTLTRKKERAEEEARVAAYLEKHPLDKVDRSYADVCEPQPSPSPFTIFKDALSSFIKSIMDKLNGDAEKAESGENETDESEEEECVEAFEEEDICGGEESFIVDPATGEVLENEAPVEMAPKTKQAPPLTAKPKTAPQKNPATPVKPSLAAEDDDDSWDDLIGSAKPAVSVIPAKPTAKPSAETPAKEEVKAPQPVASSDAQDDDPFSRVYEGDASEIKGQSGDEDTSPFDMDFGGDPNDIQGVGDADIPDEAFEGGPSFDDGEMSPFDAETPTEEVPEADDSVQPTESANPDRDKKESLKDPMNLTNKTFSDDKPLIVPIKKEEDNQATQKGRVAPPPTTMGSGHKPPAKKKKAQ